jgi:hypothetical protein
MIKYLVLDFGSQVVGGVISPGSYTGTCILNWRGFYNKWTWMFWFKNWWFENWWFKAWPSPLDVVFWVEDRVFRIYSKIVFGYPFPLSKGVMLMFLIHMSQDLPFSWQGEDIDDIFQTSSFKVYFLFWGFWMMDWLDDVDMDHSHRVSNWSVWPSTLGYFQGF